MPRYKFSDIAFNINEKRMPTPEDMATYIAPNNLETSTLSVPEFGYKVPLNGLKLVMHKGDVLFGRREPQLKHAAIAPHDGVFSAHGMIFHANEEVMDKDFFPFFISSDCFFDTAIKISVGSLSPTVNWKDLKDIEFTVPDKADQARYAAVLWAIIRAKRAYKKLIRQTDELVKSQFIEMFGDPIENSKELPVSPLSEHLDLIGGFAFKSTGFKKEGIPVLRIGNINAGYFRGDDLPFWDYDPALDRYMLYPGDLVISLTGTVGKDDYGNVCRLGSDYPRYYLNQRNAKIELHDTVVAEYITALLKDRKVKDLIAKAGVGVRQANISNKSILDLVAPVPNIADQQHFADIVRQSDKSKFELKKSLESLDTMQKALVADMFQCHM